MVSRPVVSSTAEERRRRIDALKGKISALRATSNVYVFDSDASFDTLDSLTTCGSTYNAAAVPSTLTALPESPNSEKRDNSEEEFVTASVDDQRLAALNEDTGTKLTFDDDGTEIEEIDDPLAQAHKPAAALPVKKDVADLDKRNSPRIGGDHEINALKEKVSMLRAMKKEYHFRSDISLNTFDSVSTAVSTNNNPAQMRIRNMLDRSRDVLATDQSSAASSEETSGSPTVESEDEFSTEELPATANPFLDSEDESSMENLPDPSKPATKLLMEKAGTLSKATDHSKQSSANGSSINLTQQSAASPSTYSGGSSIMGFSIDTIDEVEVGVNNQSMSLEETDTVKSDTPVSQLLAMRQANKVIAAAANRWASSSSDASSPEEEDDVEENEVKEVVDEDNDDFLEETEQNGENEKLPLSVDAKDEPIAQRNVEGSLLRDWNGMLNKEVIFKASVESPESALMTADEEEKSATDDSDTTQTCSNSNKVDYIATKDREKTLTPPRHSVVLSDGSISTKNSIFGKVVNVANHDMVAERIYYESMRAQYHAELKVHVADEEIRLALDARLKAIQDFYKKKSTVVQIQECYHDDEAKVASLPRVRPTSLQEINEVPTNPSLPQSSSYASREDNHKFAFERAHHGIDEAIKATHEQIEVVPKEEDFPLLVESASQIPETIFTNESFWSEGVEQPPTEEEMELPSNVLFKNHSKTSVNAWYFYSDVNNLLFESRLYDYEFNQLKKDPLYPYLNSLVGIADSGDDGCTNEDKLVKQQNREEYADMSPIRICHRLAEVAVVAMPKLKEICIDIGTKLSMKTFAVGPIKKASEALTKCTKKYGGDPLLVTDYCRVAMFAKDIATLLAVMEIMLTKYKSIVRRIKLSHLRADHAPLAGGYRDCKINIDVDGHICEIQLHLEQMWNIKEGKGYAHYKECKANDVDSTTTYDIKKTLSGLNRTFLSELISVGEDATQKVRLEDLHPGKEENIRNYFALACIYLKKGRLDSAEKVLSRLVRVRSDSLIFGPRHEETLIFMRKLHESLKRQHKFKVASLMEAKIKNAERSNDEDYEPDLTEMCVTDHCGAWENICEALLDPSAVEKEKLEKQHEVVEESRALWLSLRKTYWSLDGAAAASTM